MAPLSIVIDCDPGVDDAIALMVALASDRLAVQGIIAVAGNVPLSLTAWNARRIATLMGRLDVPVYGGCPRPLLRSPVTAEDIHGSTGLDGATLPEPAIALQPQHGVAYLIETLLQAPAPLTVATLGPLTNLAVALVQCPAIAAKIKQVVTMGGAMATGNVTPVAEFNIYADPHGARVVFEAGLPMTLIGLDVTHQVLTTPERLAHCRRIGTPASTAAADLLAHYGQRDCDRFHLVGAPLHDPCVMAYLLAPELFGGFSAQVAVETEGTLTCGQTVVTPHSQGTVTVIDRVDAAGVYDLIFQHLSQS